jgi:hypothetical protein
MCSFSAGPHLEAIYSEMLVRQFEEGCALGAPTLYANAFAFDGMGYSYMRLMLPLGDDRETVDRLLLLSHGRYAEQDHFWSVGAASGAPDRHLTMRPRGPERGADGEKSGGYLPVLAMAYVVLSRRVPFNSRGTLARPTPHGCIVANRKTPARR